MIALIIIGIIILVIIILLLLPVSLDIKFNGEVFLKIKYAGIKIYDVKPEDDIKKPEKAYTESDKQAEKKEKKFFEKLKEKLGFTGAIKEILSFIKALLLKVKKYGKYITVKKLKTDITISGENAFDTALEYGAVCTVFYPILSLVTTLLNVKLKQINLRSDFNNKESDLSFSAIISMKTIFLLIALFSYFKEYKNFRLRNEL